MKPNRNFVISIIIRLVAFAVFYGSGVAGWEFLERFTNHVRHGKLAEGLGSHFSLQVFAVFELLLVFIPRPKWKAALIVLYAAFMSWQWSPPSYTPYRFLYHAVFGTALLNDETLASWLYEETTKTENSRCDTYVLLCENGRRVRFSSGVRYSWCVCQGG